jgi:hypothetical protein
MTHQLIIPIRPDDTQLIKKFPADIKFFIAITKAYHRNPILTQLNPVTNLTPSFSMIYFNIIKPGYNSIQTDMHIFLSQTDMYSTQLLRPRKKERSVLHNPSTNILWGICGLRD